MKVLVVDDSKDMTTIIKIMIEKTSHRVLTANDGENGYFRYLQFKPDLVLTDIQMPGKTGFELIKEIRKHNPSIMAIYMSGDLDRFLLRLKYEQKSHRVDFIRKPFSIAELHFTISKMQDGSFPVPITSCDVQQ